MAACGHVFAYHDLLIYCLKDIRIQNIFNLQNSVAMYM